MTEAKKVFIIDAGASDEVNFLCGKKFMSAIASKLNFNTEEFRQRGQRSNCPSSPSAVSS